MRTIEVDQKWCLDAAGSIVDNLLNRASDQGGVLRWDVGFATKPSEERRALEASLGYGTPGILLFLAEYYAATGDSRIINCMEAARPGVLQLLKVNSGSAGFYMGGPGTAWALAEIRRITGIEMAPRSVFDDVIQGIMTAEPRTCAALSNGLAGSLIGLDLLQETRPEMDTSSARDRLVEQLIGTFRPQEAGLVCGRQFDAIQMPVAFYNGTSGIRHALSRYAPEGLAWLCRGLSLYEDACFDVGRGNWKEFINEAFFTGIENSIRLNRAVVERDVATFERAADSLSWGTGAAGLALGAMSNHDSSVEKALAVLGAKLDWQRPDEQTLTLFDGLGGIGLCMIHIGSETRQPQADSVLEKILHVARTQFGTHGRLRTREWKQMAHLSLLAGEAGIGHFLLKLAFNGSAPSLLYPRPKAGALTVENFCIDRVKARVFGQQFPLTLRIASTGTIELPKEPSLPSFIDAAEQLALRSAPFVHEVCLYESSRLRCESNVRSNIFLVWREIHNRETYETVCRLDSRDSTILRKWKIRRVPEAQLGMLPFHLSTQEGVVPDQSKHSLLLLHAKSSGLEEHLLTPESYQLLSLLEKSMSVGRLLKKAGRDWPLSQQAPEQRKKTVLDAVRHGLSCGYIEFI